MSLLERQDTCRERNLLWTMGHVADGLSFAKLSVLLLSLPRRLGCVRRGGV